MSKLSEKIERNRESLYRSFSVNGNPGGGFVSDFTAMRIDDEEYLLYVGSAAVNRDLDWLRRHSGGFRVAFADVTEQWAVLGLMGPTAVKVVIASWINCCGAPVMLT